MSRPEDTGYQNKRDRPTKAEAKLARRRSDFDAMGATYTNNPAYVRPGSLQK